MGRVGRVSTREKVGLVTCNGAYGVCVCVCVCVCARAAHTPSSLCRRSYRMRPPVERRRPQRLTH
jgi:hypothetical protein